MNAHEFTAVVETLDRTIAEITRRWLNSTILASEPYVRTLVDVLRQLNNHRLEMEAAEAGSETGVHYTTAETSYDSRLDAVEKRLDEIERKAERRARSLPYQ